MEYVTLSLTRTGDVFLRARGYLVAGAIIKTSSKNHNQMALAFMQQSLSAISNDSSEVVKVACIRVLQSYLQSLQHETLQPFQTAIISAISNFFSAQDPNDLLDSDELMVTIVETLRDAIALDTRVCISPESGALNLLFTIASRVPNNFQLTMLVNETFEDIARTISGLGHDAYSRLCEVVLPSLTGAFDVGSMTGETALTNVTYPVLSTASHRTNDQPARSRPPRRPRRTWPRAPPTRFRPSSDAQTQPSTPILDGRRTPPTIIRRA